MWLICIPKATSKETPQGVQVPREGVQVLREGVHVGM